MASKIKVDQIEGSAGSSITIPSGQTLTVTDGIASTSLTGTINDARLPTVPVAKGGTGLTSLGTAGQALKVNSSANGLEFGAVGGGKILQVLHGSHTPQASTSSTSFVDVSASTNVTITPSATSSKILVLAHFNELYHNSGTANTSHYIRVTRAGTEIAKAHTIYTSNLDNEEMWNQDFMLVDQPSTTSAIEYKLQFHSSNGNQVRVNQNSFAGGSTITLLEIGA